MKKKYLQIGGLLALLLAFGLGFLALWEEEAPAGPEGPVDNLAFLFQYGTPPLSIEFSGGEGEPFSLVRLALDAERNLTSDAVIPGMEDLPLDRARIGGVLNAARNLVYLDLVDEAPADYAPFGLDPPRKAVRLDFEALGVRTILIGNPAPGNIGVYIRLEGEPAVYLTPVHAVDNFLLSPLDYLNMNITPQIGWPMEFDSIHLGGRVREERGEVLITAGGLGEFELALPFPHQLNPVTGPGILHSVFGLIAHRVVAVDPPESDLEALGFDHPWSTVRVEGGDYGGFTISATQPDAAGMVFLYREGVPLVYTVAADDLPWLDIQFYQMMSPFAVSPLLEELSAIEVFMDDAHHTFRVMPGEQGPPLVYLAGDLLDSERFRAFFIAMISATMEFYEDDITELDDPIMVFVYRYISGEEQTVSFYPSPVPLRHYIRVDGGRAFLTPSSYVEEMRAEVGAMAGERAEAR